MRTASPAPHAILWPSPPELDVLINNAGISRAEAWDWPEVDIDAALTMIETNVTGTLRMTAALLPALLSRAAATIVTTTSGLAFVPRANFATYCASKAFLHSWLQSLRHQLRHTKVDVLELPPPHVQTELAGPEQQRDPAAMPLAEYIEEAIALLGGPNPTDGEILVERVKALRLAERRGFYQEVYDRLNP